MRANYKPPIQSINEFKTWDEPLKLPDSERWRCYKDHLGFGAFVYLTYEYAKVDFARWKFTMADINNIHPSYISDFTSDFYPAGREHSKTIIDILMNGTIHPIQNGYVFCVQNMMGGGHDQYDILYISEYDDRIREISDTRLGMANFIANPKGHPFSREELLKLANLNQLPE